MLYSTDSKLKVDIRRGKIMECLRLCGKVYVSELSRDLAVTPATIRSDLSELEKGGYLVRVNGGAIARSGGSQRALEFGENRSVPRAAEKEAIAETVAGMIQNGDTLFINSGTTTKMIASALKEHLNLNIVTNSLAVATALENAVGFRVTVLGGELNTKYGFTYGSDALEKLARYHADWAILSVDGVSAETGITTYHAEEALIDCQMINEAKQVLIAADDSKIGRAGFMKVCDCSDNMQIITNRSAKPELAQLRKNGISVIEC